MKTDVKQHLRKNCPYLHVKKCEVCGKSCSCYEIKKVSKSRKYNPDSSTRIREVFCNYPNVILTRRNILDKALRPSRYPERDEHRLSMAISSMAKSGGELKTYPLLGKKGYIYFTDASAL